ncbi:MAG: hypothetical protein KDD41_03500 [Flavobacteriales bacterium]|nr:hypothetical protein [Flavobacteriales bacterium]
MLKWVVFILLYCNLTILTAQEKVKYRKLEYMDFKNEFGSNDTVLAVVDIYFDKRENAAYGEMSFLPITAGLTILPQTRIIGVATSAVALPIFLHGCYTLMKFKKKRLYKTLVAFREEKALPKWLQRKVDKQLVMYKEVQREY